jgi:hypothetical protein
MAEPRPTALYGCCWLYVYVDAFARLVNVT